jgi:tetratricopeptide (TPR) repeat protein
MYKGSGMKKFFLTWMILQMIVLVNAQNDRKLIRNGISAYEDGKFADAEVEFRKAENINPQSFEAVFNTGAALYGQEKYEETVKQYESLLGETHDPDNEAQIWHNIGNSLLEAQQYGPSIEAYKNSLRKNPSDQDTRYNLAYAKQKLQDQQQQNQENQDQENQDQDQNQENQNQDQHQENQDQDQHQENQNQDQQDQLNRQQEQLPQEISREDAERMLDAIQQQEKDVKDKVDMKKAAAAKIKTEKDW